MLSDLVGFVMVLAPVLALPAWRRALGGETFLAVDVLAPGNDEGLIGGAS